jgi:hypothetical protein
MLTPSYSCHWVMNSSAASQFPLNISGGFPTSFVMIIRDYDSDANFLLSSIPHNRPLLHLYTDYPLSFVLLPDP